MSNIEQAITDLRREGYDCGNHVSFITIAIATDSIGADTANDLLAEVQSIIARYGLRATWRSGRIVCQ